MKHFDIRQISVLIFIGLITCLSLFGQSDAELRINAGKLQKEAETLTNDNKSPSLKEAEKKYLEVYKIFIDLKDEKNQAETLLRLSEVSYFLNDYSASLDYSKKALILAQKLSDKKLEMEVSGNIPSLFYVLGMPSEGLPYSLKSLSLARELGDKKSEGRTLNVLGTIYSETGEMRDAINVTLKSLEIRREIGDKAGEARTLTNLGSTYLDTSEARKAIEYLKQALQIAESLNDKKVISAALNSLGAAFTESGDYQNALDSYQKSLSIRKETGDKLGTGVSLNNIGTIYREIGDYQTTLVYMQDALKIFQELKLPQVEANSFNSIGVIYSNLGDFQKSSDYHKKALEINKQLNNKQGQAITLGNIAAIYLKQNNIDEAVKFNLEALQFAEESKQLRDLSKSNHNLAVSYVKAKNEPKANEYFTKATNIQRQGEYRQDLLKSLFEFAKADADFGHHETALEKMQEVIKLLEDLRKSFVSNNFRTQYFAEHQKYYEFYIQLLIESHKKYPEKNYLSLALQASESARARGFLDALGQNRNDIRGKIAPELIEEERFLRQTINAKENLRLVAVRENNKQKAAQFEKELTENFQKLDDLNTKILQASPQFALLNNPKPLSLEEIQTQVLDKDTVLLEYSLGNKTSFLFFATQNNLEVFELPGSEIIEQKVRETLQHLKARGQLTGAESTAQRNLRIKKADADLDKNLAEISNILLSPIVDKIQNRRLSIVASGVLQYLPFAVLKAKNGRYLIESNEVINLPSASIIPFLRRSQPLTDAQVAILADPVFSETDLRLKVFAKQTDETKTDAVMTKPQISAESLRSDLLRLRFSRFEAETIASLSKANKKFLALDFAANLKGINSESVRNAQILHLATHANVNSQFPELSSIILSLVDEKGAKQDGFLRLQDVYNLQLNADLVVLSACETALGKEIKGEGIVGLARGFMFAGSPLVAASLWSVEDRATSDLMKKFYRSMLTRKSAPISAMREAQISMIREKNFASPYYWAGFTLQGNWK